MIKFLEILDEEKTIETQEVGCLSSFTGETGDDFRNCIGVIHFYIRSVRKHFNELLVYIFFLKLGTYYIPNLTLHYNKSKISKCDGLAVYIRDTILPM